MPALVRSASRQVASPNPNGLSIPNTLATQFLPVTCPRLARTSCPRTLSLQNVPLGSCHCETCRIHGVAICLQAALVFGLLRYARNDKSLDGHEAQSLLSLQNVSFGSCHCETCRIHGVAISSQAALVLGLLRYARNDKSLDGHEAQSLLSLQNVTLGSCHCETCRIHGVAISSQAALVFGLLRYARNDKSLDGHEAQSLSP